MYSFRNDYSEGAHEKVMQALAETNRMQTIGYGEDEFCTRAKDKIREICGHKAQQIFFLTGGTQANLLTISSMLRSYEAVIGTEESHINTHETGAIEATGHKVLTCKSADGKLTPELIAEILDEHQSHHMVKPRMVYISNSTELGTIYYKKELEALRQFCKEKKLLLFVDGARLGSALTAAGNDITLRDLAHLTDCFTIGGTKNGALMGEACVINQPELAEDFLYIIKQRGGLLAKGRLLGIQFLTLFDNNLFYALAEHANEMAQKLRAGIADLGFSFLTDSPSNQLFPIFPDGIVDELGELYEFEVQKKTDINHTCIRLVTSWATEIKSIESFLMDLENIRSKYEKQ